MLKWTVNLISLDQQFALNDSGLFSAVSNYEIKEMSFEYGMFSVQKDWEFDSTKYSMTYKFCESENEIVLHMSSSSKMMMFNSTSDEMKYLIGLFANEIAAKHKLGPTMEYKINEYLCKWMVSGENKPVKEGNTYYFSNTQDVSSASRSLPGVDTPVHYPCDCRQLGLKKFNDDLMDWVHTGTPMEEKRSAWGIIQHLNDHHKWTREKIADWLDELHDKGEINIEFQPWNDDSEDEPENPCAAVSVAPLNTNPFEGEWKNVGYTTDDFSKADQKDWNVIANYGVNVIDPNAVFKLGDVT